LKKEHNNIEKLRITNNWVRCKPRLARCMNIIEDNELFFWTTMILMNQLEMEMAIILLQLFKDKYFVNGNPYLTLENCINSELRNYDYYHNEHEKLKLKLDNNILEGESNYLDI
jgi:hypothetical protein